MQDALPELDRLFYEVGTYRTSKEYLELLDFIKRFRSIAPYNAMLLHVQNPKCTYVATAADWMNRFQRHPKTDARPLVILRPFGPVSFVFDIDDTEGKPYPPHLTDPFYADGTVSDSQIQHFVLSMRNSGIAYEEKELDRDSAGYISVVNSQVKIKYKDHDAILSQPFGMTVNKRLNPPAKMATMYHELGHLYCGHLYGAKMKHIPQRYDLSPQVMEFEAESVCWLLCERHGISNPSAAYLDGYLSENKEIPDISVETVLKATAQVEVIRNGVSSPQKDLINQKQSEQLTLFDL